MKVRKKKMRKATQKKKQLENIMPVLVYYEASCAFLTISFKNYFRLRLFFFDASLNLTVIWISFIY